MFDVVHSFGAWLFFVEPKVKRQFGYGERKWLICTALISKRARESLSGMQEQGKSAS